jgi:hypothetical protein
MWIHPARPLEGRRYCSTAIELGVFPTLYVESAFKLPLLTPNA